MFETLSVPRLVNRLHVTLRLAPYLGMQMRIEPFDHEAHKRIVSDLVAVRADDSIATVDLFGQRLAPFVPNIQRLGAEVVVYDGAD